MLYTGAPGATFRVVAGFSRFVNATFLMHARELLDVIATFDAERLDFWLWRAGTGLSQVLPTTQLLPPPPARPQKVRAAHKDPKRLQSKDLRYTSLD